MIDRLEKIQEKYLRISEELNQAKDPSSLKNLYKERSRLTPLYLKVEEYLKIYKDRKDAEELIQSEKDEEMHSMLKEEIREANLKLETLEREFEILLLPPDPNSGKNILVEIRAGTGGEEAGLFVADLFRMYSKFADKQKIKTEIIDSSPTGIGGLKEIIFALEDDRAYDLLSLRAGHIGFKEFQALNQEEEFIRAL